MSALAHVTKLLDAKFDPIARVNSYSVAFVPIET